MSLESYAVIPWFIGLICWDLYYRISRGRYPRLNPWILDKHLEERHIIFPGTFSPSPGNIFPRSSFHNKASRQASKQASKQAKQASKQASQARKQASKQPSKAASKQASKQAGRHASQPSQPSQPTSKQACKPASKGATSQQARWQKAS